MRAGHVLHSRRNGQQRRTGGQSSQGGDGGDHGAGTGLVHLHLFHSIRRLDADAARVEADALADDGKAPTCPVRRVPFAGTEHDHSRRVVAALPNGEEHAHAQFRCPDRPDDVYGEAVALGNSPGLACQNLRCNVVGRPVGQASSQVGALTYYCAAFGSPHQACRIRTGRHENQLIQGGRYVLVAVAIDGGRLELALDDAPGEQLGDRDRSAIDPIPKVAQPDGERLDAPTGQTPLDGGSNSHDHLPRDRLGVTCADRQKPAGAELPGSDDRRAVALGLELPEGGQCGELAARAPVYLRQDAVEPGLAHEWDGEHVGRDFPGLIAHDAQLHSQILRPRLIRGTADPSRRRETPAR